MPARGRSELRAGVIVVLVTCGAIAVVLCLPNAFTNWTKYSTAVPLAWSADGVHFGSQVLLGGMNVGQVEEVGYGKSAGEEPAVILSFVVRSQITLRQGTTVRMAHDLVSGQAQLLITLPEKPGAPLREGSIIPLAPSPSAAELALGPAAGATIAQAQADLASFMDEWRKVPPPGEAFGAVREGWTALAARVEERVPRWRSEWDAALAAAQQARASASGLTADLVGQQGQVAHWRGRYESLVEQFPQIANEFAAIRSAFTSELAPRGEAIFTHAQQARDGLLEELQLIDDVVAESRLAQGEATAEMVLLSEQIDRLTTEVVLMPWSLLGGVFGDPNAQQQAMREMAQARMDLQEALAALRHLLEAAPEMADRHPELLRLLRAWMEAAGANAADVSEAIRSISGGNGPPPAN